MQCQLNIAMEHDLILACGDSYTEGCQDIIGKGVNGTWPGVVANHFGVPCMNLAEGGSSNTAIALQPVNTPLDEHWKEILGGAKKPLIIFAFTVMHRWTYFHPHYGGIQSHYSVDPQHMDKNNGSGNEWIHLQKHIPIKAFESYTNWAKTTTGKDYQVENYTWATMIAVKTAMQYQSLIPGATVLWGFIHEHSGAQSFGKDIKQLLNNDGDIIVDGVDWYSMGNCFNKWFDYKPLERVIKEDDIISPNDTHPNSKGIQSIANIFIEGLNGI